VFFAIFAFINFLHTKNKSLMANIIYLLLGSNMGNRLSFLKQARKHITKKIGKITKTSSIYETAAWGKENQSAFLNQVLLVESDEEVTKVLALVLAIEQEIGRKRLEKWGERIIDIDILLYNNIVIETKNLIVPHPYLHLRRFTLLPLAEIAADIVHSKLEKSIRQLLTECDDVLEVSIFEA